MATIQRDRLNQAILKEITQIIQYELKDPKVGFVTITDVEVSNEHSYASVYVTFLGKKERNDAGIKALNRAKGFIRTELSKRLSIRRVPELTFKIDASMERQHRIDELIMSIHKDDEISQ